MTDRDFRDGYQDTMNTQDILTNAMALGFAHPDVKFPAKPKILGASTKTAKGEGVGILTAVVYLSPAKESGVNLCLHATGPCIAGCLARTSGRMVFDSVRNSRLWKTAFYLGDREVFRAQLLREIDAHARKARKLGMTAAIRFDGSSDTGYGRYLATQRPDVVFYDYTKDAARAHSVALSRSVGLERNYHVTLSWSGQNVEACERMLRLGGNVAIPFATKDSAKIPSVVFVGDGAFRTLDADVTDARFIDPKGHIAALTWKGPMRNAKQPFAMAI